MKTSWKKVYTTEKKKHHDPQKIKRFFCFPQKKSFEVKNENQRNMQHSFKTVKRTI